MESSDFVYERVTLEFRGSTAGTFLRLLDSVDLHPIDFPNRLGNRDPLIAGWSNGSASAMEPGQPSWEDPARVWGWLALSAGIGYRIPNLVLCLISGSNPIAFIIDPQVRQDALASAGPSARNLHVASGLAFLPIVIYVELVVYRWFVAGIKLTGGPDLHFTGRYFPLLGWTLLIGVSLLTIIGWAWVSTAFFRWLAINVEGDAVGFEFEGSGWGFLWRMSVVVGLPFACILILALNGITWAWSWVAITPWILLTWTLVIRWYVGNTVMIKVTTSTGAALTGAPRNPRTTTPPPVRKSPPPRATIPPPVRKSPPPRATIPPPVRKSPPPRATIPPPKRKAPPSKNPTPPPADPPPDVPFPLVVESKYG